MLWATMARRWEAAAMHASSGEGLVSGRRRLLPLCRRWRQLDGLLSVPGARSAHLRSGVAISLRSSPPSSRLVPARAVPLPSLPAEHPLSQVCTQPLAIMSRDMPPGEPAGRGNNKYDASLEDAQTLQTLPRSAAGSQHRYGPAPRGPLALCRPPPPPPLESAAAHHRFPLAHTNSAAVYVGNYEYDASERELERTFEKYGDVDRVEYKSGGCCRRLLSPGPTAVKRRSLGSTGLPETPWASGLLSYLRHPPMCYLSPTPTPAAAAEAAPGCCRLALLDILRPP